MKCPQLAPYGEKLRCFIPKMWRKQTEEGRRIGRNKERKGRKKGKKEREAEGRKLKAFRSEIK